ncbi:hypothetical protein PICMEDRAFT_17144 [Pichia membranifaciens NRRL Y-2026]|uniref:2-dehydropantolactone reductase n=1 Tax=Pichia membranifaciens NRRL Y-2026 TaxID=763406 RepID=A0A1E3NIH5_9ASCO|nr:hypothetical protein PICMEDRAFT_17144 [Pichia membranifaciens NRRL Y-2026]ODQ45886.1 hypothetical protein PICMEDRAFT_17144 [Pichia membranifaciens NRRL Y-2026]
MTLAKIPTFTLARTGAAIPALGFGSGSKHRIKKWENAEKTGEAPLDADIVDVLSNAIKAGFTHLDGAETYTTRGELALAVRNSGVPREQLWITDKFDQGWPHYDRKSPSPSGPRESVLKGLETFQMEYYDLFLIHAQFFREDLVGLSIVEAWQQLEQCYEEGLVKNIGVSNFDVQHLQQIVDAAKYKPQVNQIEYNLYLQNQTEGIADYCRKHEIQLEAYCPLTPILDARINDENHPLKPVIREMADKYNVSPNILALRWVYQSGVIPITTSSNFERMKQTFQIFDFELSEKDFNTLKSIGQTYTVRTHFNQYFD